MIRIVTDSVAGIPPEVAAENDIIIASLFVNHEDREYEDATMDIDAFYGNIHAMVDDPPTSSQPSVHTFEAIFDAAAEAGDEVLGIFISAQLSGTFDGALRAARSVQARNADFHFCLVDSLTATFDEAFPVFAAVAARDAGCTLEGCVEHVKHSIRSSRVLFTPESLLFLKAGGRIGSASALLGSMMKICPLITVSDGRVDVMAKVRTHKKAIEAIAKRFKEDIEDYGFRNAVVHYIGDPADAIQWAKEVIEPLCQRAVAVTPVSPVIGLHVGPAYGVAYECDEPLPGKLTPGYEIPVYYS